MEKIFLILFSLSLVYGAIAYMINETGQIKKEILVPFLLLNIASLYVLIYLSLR